MASNRLFFSFFVLSALLFMFIQPTYSSSSKVDLALYYETLCPSCADFIVNDLVNVFQKDLLSIVNLKLVPYGNAKIQAPNRTIICQHGKDECYLNTIEACAIDVWPFNNYFSFIKCVESKTLDQKQSVAAEKIWQSCSHDLKMNPKPINDCYQNGKGAKLILRNSHETDRLKPPHTYVPWVVVDDKPLYEDFGNYVKYVCKAYKGKYKPEACKSLRVRPTKQTQVTPNIWS